MAKKLDLSSDQESRLEPILAVRMQQVGSTKSDASLAPKEKRARLRAIRQDADSRIEAMLSETQKQQYAQMKQNHKAKLQQPSGAPPGP